MQPKPTDKPASKPGTLTLIGQFFVSRQFWFTILGVVGATALAFLLLDLGLKWMTNHGQRLEVGDYTKMSVEEAEEAIDDDDFEIEIIDSIYLVDQPANVVLRQDPPPGSFVKEDRRIYLTITKAVADMVVLPPLAGTYELDRYERKLSLIDLTGVVKSREYSNKYQPNTILKVFYEGKEVSEQELRAGYRVPRGTKLEFIVSSKEGGEANLPNLRCRTYDEARFLLQNYRLQTGEIEEDATVIDLATAYVWRQDPPFEPGASIPFDSEVKLFLTQEQPAGCDGI